MRARACTVSLRAVGSSARRSLTLTIHMCMRMHMRMHMCMHFCAVYYGFVGVLCLEGLYRYNYILRVWAS